ncbi:hypothetical protein MASR1M60_14150 [Rhodocyclaceae bacterium]
MLLISFLLILVALAPVLWPIAKIKALFSKNPEDTNEPDGVTNTQQVTYHPPSAEDVARAVEGLYNNPVTRK